MLPDLWAFYNDANYHLFPWTWLCSDSSYIAPQNVVRINPLVYISRLPLRFSYILLTDESTVVGKKNCAYTSRFANVWTPI